MSSRIIIACLLTVFFISFSQIGMTQTVGCVTESGAGTTNGTSWMNATSELQEAIDAAKSGD